jgi:flavin reductase (DIM6/NTAB) family NADH-FMN oxidoreductase RutF
MARHVACSSSEQSHASTDRAADSLPRHAGCADQYNESRWVTQHLAHVFCLVAGVELHARAGCKCVLNLPSASEVAHVDRLARKTASDPMPPHKVAMGWEIERDKFGRAGLTPQASLDVVPPRAAECPVQLEAHLIDDRAFAESDPRMGIAMRAIEVRITRVHANPELLSKTHADRFDPDAWNPLLMSFLQFYARGENVHPSHLGELPQEAWAGKKPRRLHPGS